MNSNFLGFTADCYISKGPGLRLSSIDLSSLELFDYDSISLNWLN